MLPNFLGLGAPKAATTWLFHCLQEHPEIFVADSKEVTFFDYGSIEGRLKTYEAHFSSANNETAVGEISTRYLASWRAPERVKQLIPKAKFIVSLRRPSDQIYSHYWHLRRQNFHMLETSSSLPTFEQALETMPELLLTPAYYFRNLSNWLRYFDRSRFHIILFDDIESNPARVISGLYTFLEVDAKFSPTALNPNRHQMRKGMASGSAFKEAVYRQVYASAVRYLYRPLKSAIGVRRADRLKTNLKAREVMERLFHDTDYPKMPASIQKAIARRFDSDVHALSILVGRPLHHWTSDGH